jgi:hypothetical protein
MNFAVISTAFSASWFLRRQPLWQIAMKAFELANHYMFGKPVQPVASEELAPPINDISAIPKFRVPAS